MDKNISLTFVLKAKMESCLLKNDNRYSNIYKKSQSFSFMNSYEEMQRFFTAMEGLGIVAE